MGCLPTSKIKYLVFGFSVALAGCAQDPNRPMTHTQSGALIGAIGGAVVGAMAYKKNSLSFVFLKKLVIEL